jgi:serine/threonine protein kinase
VKICDLGLSKRIEGTGGGSTTVKGTPGFLAPELVGFINTEPRKADPYAADVWCLGEMTFQMLCARPAFPSLGLLGSYHVGTATFPADNLRGVGASELAVAFITGAMVAEPRQRLTVHQAMEHNWLEITGSDDGVSDEIYAA